MTDLYLQGKPDSATWFSLSAISLCPPASCQPAHWQRLRRIREYGI